jgi:hypothetical protein
MTQLLDGLAGPEQETALLRHTAECAACRAEWQAIQEVHTLLSAAPMVPPPTGFTQRVLARLAGAQPGTAVARSSRPLESAPSAASVPQALGTQPSKANPWGGALALLIGTVLTSTLVALPVLSRVVPALWTALTRSAGLGQEFVEGLRIAGGLAETTQMVWGAYWTLLRSVSPILLLVYAVVALTAALFWLRLVTGIQQTLHVRK